MPIKFQYDDETGIPEKFKELYRNVDGKFVADIEGVKPFDEYKKVYQEAADLREKYKGLETKISSFGEMTPEQVVELQEKIKELEAKASQTKDPTEVNKLAREIAASEAKVYQKQITSLEAEKGTLAKMIDALNQEKIQRKMEDRLRKVSSGKINPDVFEDIVLNAQRDGLVYNELENDFFHDKSGRSIERWLNDMLEVKKYWMPYSETGNASGGNGVGTNKMQTLEDYARAIINKK